MKASEAKVRPTPVEPGLLPQRHLPIIRLFRLYCPDWLAKCAFSAIHLCLTAAFVVVIAPAVAHDLWSNGKPVPGWIKSACCGEADAHRLRPDQVRQNARGDYVVQGYHDPIAANFALPSADGDYWIFYRENLDGSRSAVFCFFVPLDF